MSNLKLQFRAAAASGSVGSGEQRVLTPADLSFAGYLRFPADLDDLWYSYGQVGLRRVGGQLRLFTCGNLTHDFPILEYSVPEPTSPGTALGSSPFLTAIQSWGTLPDSLRITGGSGGSVVGGVVWDEAREGLWVAYKDWYAPVEHHPTVIFVHTPASTHVGVNYGPWRTEWNSQLVGGAPTMIPQSFVDTYMGGGSTLAATSYFGGAGGPFGAILSRVGALDPFTTAPDRSVPIAETPYPPWTFTSGGLIRHDSDHRMARDQRYKVCGWNGEVYDCSAPGVPVPVLGPPTFGGFGSNDQDTVSSALWIDLPDVHGVLFFGQLGSTPVGYTAPGDPDGISHVWYGAALSTANPMGAERYCCHSQYDQWWNATGPGAHTRVAKGWIYDPADMVATATGAADPWTRVPTTDAFEWNSLFPLADGPVRPGFWGQSAFDPTTRRIYVGLAYADYDSFIGPARPAIAVFDVLEG